MKVEESLALKMQKHLQPLHMELENESHMHSVPKNSETHFKLLLVSNKFVGQSRVARTRMVNELLDEERAAGLHALALKLLTPEEWHAVKDTLNFISPNCASKK